MWNEFRDWSNWVAEWFIVGILIAEFYYDKAKDDAKKQKRTKTTKRTIPQISGGNIVEETTETSEPMNQDVNQGETK